MNSDPLNPQIDGHIFEPTRPEDPKCKQCKKCRFHRRAHTKSKWEIDKETNTVVTTKDLTMDDITSNGKPSQKVWRGAGQDGRIIGY